MLKWIVFSITLQKADGYQEEKLKGTLQVTVIKFK